MNIDKIVKIITMLVISLLFISCSNNKVDIKVSEKQKLYVYNWGIYLDRDVIKKFEDKYDCEVVYDEFDTN
ncbi:MAG: hypothetical protein IJT67_00615, partial [Lachnospiraceae bacterium]|nr:hypothetical protein [Lachnospiraceae bacterium]